MIPRSPGRWDGRWQYRAFVTCNNDAINEDLEGFPVLVELTADRIDYGGTAANGIDLTNGAKLL